MQRFLLFQRHTWTHRRRLAAAPGTLRLEVGLGGYRVQGLRVCVQGLGCLLLLPSRHYASKYGLVARGLSAKAVK